MKKRLLIFSILFIFYLQIIQAEELSINIASGIFFPNFYIEKLKETKSHVMASNIFYEQTKNNKNAIIISSNKIEFVFSFHEGISRKIENIISDQIILNDDYGDNDYKIFIIDENTIRDDNNIIYTRISDDIVDWRKSISAYITKFMFGEKVYINNNEHLYRNNYGNIIINNVEYEIHLDTVFSNREYDYLWARDKMPIHFRIIDDGCEIYRQEIPEEYYDDPVQEKYAKYTLLKMFK